MMRMPFVRHSRILGLSALVILIGGIPLLIMGRAEWQRYIILKNSVFGIFFLSIDTILFT